MLKSHVKFHSANGKRLILVADDELINREILGAALNEEYDILYAQNGKEALDAMIAHHDMLSLLLLDLNMPVMSGTELLGIIQQTPELKRIPVIVLTADQSAEIESLRLGAMDFIPKPYPDKGVILARILRTIELFEDRQIIQSTERERLTGLYNREYFYRYAEQYDQYHRDTEMDAIVMDINHFRMVNERYGRPYGDEILRRIGQQVRSIILPTEGIVCREGDTFLLYCPHTGNYAEILDAACVSLDGEDDARDKLRLRMGVYSRVDKSIDIERRFDRAKSACDTVRGNYTNNIAFYDIALLDSELYNERLIDDFHTAIRENQFVVHYQPKFYADDVKPVLASAEALVRWKHPELGMISPGVFIPLFEENGLIQELDMFVWRSVAAQLKEWKAKYGVKVPVSVNVSRIDMYDPELVEKFQALLDEFDLEPDEYILEITESAYTKESTQIIDIANRLRALGFKIEMDDFGTGYSSLNMISSLPIDALKLDMKFVRDAFRDGRDTRMIEIIVDIADYLSVPVIAEGVETEEQYHALKMMGCDIMQGYYFSRPLPANEYERFVKEKYIALGDNLKRKRYADQLAQTGSRAISSRVAHALTRAYEVIYYVDLTSGQYVQFSANGGYESLHVELSGTDFFAETQRNILRVVYAEDREFLASAMDKETLLDKLRRDDLYTARYRLLIDGKPTYYELCAVTVESQQRQNIVIGVSNIQNQATREAG